MSELLSFLTVNNRPLNFYTRFCLPILPSLDIGVASMLWLLWIVLPWTLICRYLLEFLPSVLLGIYPEVESLDHMVTLYLTSPGITILFPVAWMPVYWKYSWKRHTDSRAEMAQIKTSRFNTQNNKTRSGHCSFKELKWGKGKGVPDSMCALEKCLPCHQPWGDGGKSKPRLSP